LTGRTRTEEVPMPRDERSIKTLAIRLDDRLHAQLSVLAQLGDTSVTDLIRKAIERYIETERSQGNLAERAAGVLEDIEREANTRKSAIQALFADSDPAPDAEPDPPAPRRGRRVAEEAGEQGT
jgi:predicted transcriptional regulator